MMKQLTDCYTSDSFVWPKSSNHLEVMKRFSLRLLKSNSQKAREVGWAGVFHLEAELSKSDEEVVSVLEILTDRRTHDPSIWPESTKHVQVLARFSLNLVQSNSLKAREAGWVAVSGFVAEFSSSSHATTSRRRGLAEWIERNQILSLALGCSTHHVIIPRIQEMLAVIRAEQIRGSPLQERHLQIALKTCKDTDSPFIALEMHTLFNWVRDSFPSLGPIVEQIMHAAVLRRIELNDHALTGLRIGHGGNDLVNGEALLELHNLNVDDCLRIGNAIGQNVHLTRIQFAGDAVEHLEEFHGEGFSRLVHVLENSKTITDFCLSSCALEGGAGNELILTAGEMKSVRRLSLSECELDGWGIHPLIRSLRKLQMRLQALDLRGCLINNTVLKLILPSLRNLCELQEISLRDNNLQNQGCLHLVDLLAGSHCNIHTLDIENNGVDSEGVLSIANALTANSKFRSLSIAGNNVNQRCWSAFSRLLCRTDKNTTRLSNHTLCSIEHPDIPDELQIYLQLNKDTNKKRVLVKKILYHNGHFSMEQYFSWGLRLVPNVVDWFDKAHDYFESETNPVVAFEDEDIRRRKLDAIYQFVKDTPSQFAESLSSVLMHRN